MLKKLQNRKKNNKGFSLVELIVVILIMAIIAVALAPQVMKWVNESRVSTDLQTSDMLKSVAQVALTDEDAYAEVIAFSATQSLTITCSSTSGTVIAAVNGATIADFTTAFTNGLGDSLANVKAKDSANNIVITVSKDATTGEPKVVSSTVAVP